MKLKTKIIYFAYWLLLATCSSKNYLRKGRGGGSKLEPHKKEKKNLKITNHTKHNKIPRLQPRITQNINQL
jgi:hypothetical protein